MSQPAFSKCIKEMEQSLGCALFLRTPHGVSLTDAGAAFLPHARSMSEAYDELRSFVASRQSGRRKMLRIAVSLAIGPVVHMALASKIQNDPCSAALQLSVMSSEDVLNQVAKQRVEFGLCGEMVGDPDIRYTPLLEAPLGLIVPTDCDLPEPVHSLDDLAAFPLVRLADNTPVSRLLRREEVRFPAYFESKLVFTCLSSAIDLMRRERLAAVGTGIGASLLPARDFRFIPLPGLLPKMVVYLISARLQSGDDGLERMRDLVRSSVHQSPWHPSVRRLNQMDT